MILAIISLIKPVRFKKDTVRKDMFMSVASGIVLFVMMADKWFGNSDINLISRSEGIILLILFAMFMYYNLYGYMDEWRTRKEKDKEIKLKLKDIDALTKNIVFLILGLILVFVGAKMTVNAVEKIAVIVGLSETFISILIIAVGTSLPEVFTSISAVRKGKHDIAIGNLIGSNMFNILFILGSTALINPIVLQMDTLVIDAFVFLMVMTMLLLHSLTAKEHQLTKQEGILLLSIYATYVMYVVVRG